MVNGDLKSKFVVITLVITIFLLGAVSITSAKRINDEEVKEIKTFLKVSNFPFLSDYTEEDLKKFFNKVIKPEIPGITYGLLVLSAKDDLEWIDMILSQDFLDRNREYFNNVLDRRLSLFSQWRKIGQDAYFFISKREQIGPLAGLASEVVSITNKTIEVFTAFDVWKTTETYKGIWRYFDARRHGYVHEEAWGDAKAEMGWASKSLIGFKANKKTVENETVQLETQFVALWDKWGAYATPFGISDEYKKQVRNEIGSTLATVLATQSFTEESKLSLIDRLAEQFKKIKDTALTLINQINPFKAGPIVNLPPEELMEVKPPSVEESELIEAKPPSIEAEIQPVIDESIEELIEASPPSIEEPEMSEVEPQSDEPQEIEEVFPEETPELEEIETTPSPPAPEPEPVPEPVFCGRTSGNPTRFRILINEIAWMGTSNSANDEWIELKNVWGIPINLAGWQLLDKDQQIKIVFNKDDNIPANGFYLLERTDDDTLPNITADFIYTGALNNIDEALYLFDADCQLEDEVIANPNWPAGDNIEKRSMERLDTINWHTGIADGTPKRTNSLPPSQAAPSPEPEPEPEPAPAPESATEEPLLTILINEIAWMGTSNSANDEWIELYNNTASSINITGWRLISDDGSPDIVFSTSTIAANDFYLIERTDDNTISDITADLIYTGALNNDGEKLELRDADNNLIDLVDCTDGWLAGDNTTKQTMERIDANNWASNNRVPWYGWQGKDADGNRINGTPKSENSVIKTSTTLSPGVFAIDDNFTLTSLGNPYSIEGSITVASGAKLTIESGVTIKFKHSDYWKSELKVEGELAATDVVFTSFYDATGTEPSAGDWEWLYFKDAQASLENVIIKYAGKKEGSPPFSPPFTRGAVYIDGGQTTIKNSKIEKSQTLGIWLKNSSNSLIDNVEFLNTEGDWEKSGAVYIENSNPIIKNSTFENNDIGIWIESAASPSIENNVFEGNELAIKTFTLLASFSDNTAQNNNFNGILVSGLGFSSTINQVNLQKANLPYIFESSTIISSGQILNIKPGVVVQFKSGSRIYINGTLKAEGTENEKIIFTSLVQASAGAWDFISFSASSINSILDHIIVRYGGWYNAPFKSGAIKINNTEVSIANSLFESNLIAGLELENCTTTITNTTFKDHQAQYGAAMENSKGFWLKNATPVFSSTVFNDNYYGIYIESGDCPDLAGVTFGADENANSIDIHPSNCM